MPRNESRPVRMNIPGPLCRIVVRAIADVGIKGELEMVMSIDQPGEQQIAREVEAISLERAFRLVLGLVPVLILDRLNAFSDDRDVSRYGCVCAKGTARSFKEN